MNRIMSMLLKDGYKSGHPFQYPDKTGKIYINWTCRESRLDGVKHSVFFGLQYFIKEYLIKQFNHNFFMLPKEEVVAEYKRRMRTYLGNPNFPTAHIEALHDLGYLPIKIKALPEGTRCPLRVPMFTVTNTLPAFYWVPNFLETIMSCSIWTGVNSATIAYEYKKLLDKYARETSDMPEFVPYQGHDFSFRGMSSLESACISGMAHLTSFIGTDTIPAIDCLEEYYGANSDNDIIGASIPATEHSVSCLLSAKLAKDFNGDLGRGELEHFRYLITKVYPKGNVSIVSDTWDYWRVLTEFLPILKDEIMAREGTVVIRPDTGDPVKVVCGDSTSSLVAEQMGSTSIQWEVFGGRRNSKNYKQLDSHIGLIYGDSITLARTSGICEGLKNKQFASTNVALGMGSYTYQMNTRDTIGQAIKATYGEVDGEAFNIFKKPKTGNGMKDSAKGLLAVMPEMVLCPGGRYYIWGELQLLQECTPEQENTGLLQTVFEDGTLTREFTLGEIRKNLGFYQ